MALHRPMRQAYNTQHTTLSTLLTKLYTAHAAPSTSGTSIAYTGTYSQWAYGTFLDLQHKPILPTTYIPGTATQVPHMQAYSTFFLPYLWYELPSTIPPYHKAYTGHWWPLLVVISTCTAYNFECTPHKIISRDPGSAPAYNFEWTPHKIVSRHPESAPANNLI